MQAPTFEPEPAPLKRGERIRATMKVPHPPPRFVVEPTPEAQAFRFRSGALARSMTEFRDELGRIDGDTLWYHRSHFVPWLRDVLGDDPLARRVEGYATEARDAEVLREVLVDLVAKRAKQLQA